ncbi:MAG: hypothetical protein KJO18_07090 [Acidimicrobiia bacterium]|nr:hypothetical protein [Acidimicrobiia bacterium]
MDDVFAIQQDIALNIAETLPIVLDDQKREQLINSGTRSIEAFIEFQRAYRVFDQAHLDLQTMMENLIPANELFEATLAVDPELGAAWFLHSDYFSHWLSIDAVLERDRDPASESEITAAFQTLMSDLERAVSATSAPEQRRIIDIEHRMFSDSWQGLGGIVETSAASRTCVTSNWFIGFAPLLSEPIAEFYSRAVLCDPLNYLNWLKFFASTHWTGDAEALRSEIARGIEVTGTRTTWTEWYRVQSHLLEGDFAGARSVPTDFQGEGLVNVPYEVNILAAEGRAEEARALFSSLYDPTIHRLDTQLMMAAIVGDREEANRIASSIDGRPVSELALLMTTLFCACGEVFDLDATPEFKARVSESGLAWPPATLVSYPAKTW